MKKNVKRLLITGLVLSLALTPIVSNIYVKTDEADAIDQLEALEPIEVEEVIEDEVVPLAAGNVLEKNGTKIDYSTAANGYVKVSNTTAKKRLKVQVIRNNTTYNYDLKNGGKVEIYPLHLGEGDYKIRVLENTTGNKYTPLAEQTLNVKLKNSLVPFLNPNQYIMYGSDWAVAKKAAALTKNAKTDKEKIELIYNYIIKNVKYDKQKAATVQAGYLPNVDETMSTGKGICFDYAALLSAMLRSQGIPSRMIIGTVSPKDIDHAWNEIYTKEDGWVVVKIEFKGNQWNRMDSTFAATGGDDIQNFIGNGQNYTGLRLY